MRIIPAIDIIDGKCVRLTQGDYTTQRTYSLNPVEVAKMFADSGLQYLHLVDLDGARLSKIINYKVLEAITSQTNLHVDFGGGMRSTIDVNIAFNSGARQITAGSIAVQDSALVAEWLSTFGSDRIILGADCLNMKVATHGWQQQSTLEVIDFIGRYQHQGISSVICTDISKDGMLNGPATDLYADIISKTAVRLIASGGIATISDLVQLKALGCDGAIVGKAIYEGTIKLKDLEKLC